MEIKHYFKPFSKIKDKKMKYSQILALLVLLTASAGKIQAEAPVAAPVKNNTDILRPAEKAVIIRNNTETKFASAAEAVAAAETGDVIVLGPGLHRGPLAFRKSGVQLTGEPGAYVTAYDGSWKPDWKKDPKYGSYAYSSPISFEPAGIAIDGRVMINADENRHGLDIHEDGVARNDRTPQQSMFTYISKEKRLLVSFAREVNPADHRIEACPEKTPVIKIDGVDGCIVQNLIIAGGSAGVQFTKTRGSAVRKCLIFGTDIGVHLSSGATECKVLECDITWNADAMNGDCDQETGLVDNDVWNAHKHYGTYDCWGVFADNSGKDNEVAYNYIYDIWDGIEAGGGGDKAGIADYYRNKVFKGISEFNIGLKVHNNRLDLCLDDALEPGGELVGNQWYSNVISRAKCAIRIKTVSLGPFFVYDNLFFKCSDGMRFYKSMPDCATVYVYHNIIEFPSAIIYHATDSVAWNDPELKKMIKPGTPGFNVFNNIFLCEKQFSNSSGVKPNFKGDFNLYTSGRDQSIADSGIDQHGIFDAKPEFIDQGGGNWLLKDGSPGKTAGMDLSKFSVKLPACDVKYFKDALPDIGLLGLDKARTPRAPVSGLWEIADKSMKFGERDDSQFKISPLRWATAKKLEYVIENLPEKGKEIDLKLTTPSAEKFKIKVTSDDGKVLAEKNGSDAESIERVFLKISSGGWKSIIIAIDNPGNNEWRIEPLTPGLKVGINVSKPLSLSKYDGGRYILEYDIPAGIDSFKVSGDGCEIQRPDGKTEKPGNGGIVNTAGQPGTYRIMLQFIKRSPLSVEGPSKYAFFDGKQETVPLRKRWGKQGF